MNSKVTIGSEEWVSLVELNIPYIKARIDSGAKTSSLHALNIQPYQKDGQNWVSFDVYPIQNDGKRRVKCNALVTDKRFVKSSTGNREQRFVIQTFMTIGDHTWSIEITLTNRDSMGYRMLFGREAMKGRLIVDPEKSFSLGNISDSTVVASYEKFRNTTTGLRIGLLASNQELYSNRRII